MALCSTDQLSTDEDRRRRNPIPFAMAGFVGVLGLAGLSGLDETAVAQSGGHRMMVMDDGGGPMVMHITGPDVRALKTPDFLLSDLPTFTERLRLEDAQSTAVHARLEAYIEAFMKLAQDKLPAIDPMAFRQEGQFDFRGGPGGEGGDPMGNIIAGLGGPEGIEGLDIEMDGPGEIRIAITAGGPGGGGGEFIVNEDVDVREGGGVDGPVADVMVAIESADGEEIPEEVKKKLQEHAEKIAEKIREQMENGEMGNGGPLGGGLTGPERMAQHEQRAAEIDALSKEFKQAKEQLRREFVNDVQAGLQDGQLEYWPSLDRALTRVKTLPNGRLDGERTDVLAVLEEIAPDAAKSAALHEQREAYEITLHDNLVRRNAFLEDADARVSAAISSGEPGKALVVLDRATQLRLGVRRTNEQFASTFEQSLDSDTAKQFRRRILEESYPRVYRRNTGLRAFEEARGLDGLEEEKLLQILDLESPYRTELALVNSKLKRRIDKHQPNESRRGILQMQAMMDGALDGGPVQMSNNEDDPIHAAFEDRQKLDERYMKMLYDLLTPEQVAALPKLPSKRQRGPTMFRRSVQEPH